MGLLTTQSNDSVKEQQRAVLINDIDHSHTFWILQKIADQIKSKYLFLFNLVCDFRSLRLN